MNRPRDGALVAAFRRDRATTLGALALLTGLAWLYTLRAGAHHAAGGSSERLVFMLAMWSVMMIAMMAPAAAPDVVVCTGKRSRFRDFGRNWNMSGRSGEYAEVEWQGP